MESQKKHLKYIVVISTNPLIQNNIQVSQRTVFLIVNACGFEQAAILSQQQSKHNRFQPQAGGREGNRPYYKWGFIDTS